ncbi:PREDICTED: E3 ubiquitin-protein ligase ORTHRUS 2-like [Camelina sativa]|uniref:RING-type E3 ubiquitin transferase n=1 Tax=Camelina sativa TaxID=90675 RepID=A0ABM0SQT8_CAMSA|nr:PREDICTED: E3 ubiquitin-protein ligase ORTHRUS 2-like [Camelina sativa]
MASRVIQLPCNGDGVCMRCKSKPLPEVTLTCGTCVTPWHVSCLSSPPETLAFTFDWLCPDCSGDIDPLPVSGVAAGYGSGCSDLVAAIHAIEADASLSAEEKARKRQQVMSGKAVAEDDEEEKKKMKKGKGKSDVLSTLDENFICFYCMSLLDLPVTTPCGHNVCLKCFKKWMSANKKPTCGKCRTVVPLKIARDPRINLSIVAAIRLAKDPKRADDAGTSKDRHFVSNQDRPEKAFTTERAKKTGNANASGGRIFVTMPNDHFGPIPAENDPCRNLGVLVGESWADRHECRQWGVHFPQVSGIAGQAKHGAQSVVISGGYVDDEDHGEWFLYTGSGGRDLSRNKRTAKIQSHDQVFKNKNAALRLSCKMGYPVRVIRSHKVKCHSAYAPMEGVRYDGVYRIEKCWRKVGKQGSFKVCRYLFVRCDNEPAPWTSDEQGDRPRPIPNVPELNMATDLFERKESPSWDFDEGEGRWRWMKPPPASKLQVNKERKSLRTANSNTVRGKLLKEFSCLICRQVMTLPVTTPCAHNFCKPCLEAKFAGTTVMRERSRGGRTLRAQKNVMKCPYCPTDLSDFLPNLQVNRDVMDLIERLKNEEEENAEPEGNEGESSGTNSEEETDVFVSEEAEQPKKRIKLDTDAVITEAVVESDME